MYKLDTLSAYIKETAYESLKVKESFFSDQGCKNNILNLINSGLETFASGGKIIFAGNGGSAADSQHLAAEFVSRFEYDRPGLPSIALSTDTSMITAIGNDYGFDNLFSRQLEAQGKAGDLFIGITTSGKSPNIINAFKTCQKMSIKTAAFCGANGILDQDVDISIAVPSLSTARVQECHIMVGHILCGLIERKIFPK